MKLERISMIVSRVGQKRVVSIVGVRTSVNGHRSVLRNIGTTLADNQRARFVGVFGVEVSDGLLSVVETERREPTGRVFAFVTKPLYQVHERRLATTIELRIEDLRDFVLEFSLDFDGRWRRLNTTGESVSVVGL